MCVPGRFKGESSSLADGRRRAEGKTRQVSGEGEEDAQEKQTKRAKCWSEFWAKETELFLLTMDVVPLSSLGGDSASSSVRKEKKAKTKKHKKHHKRERPESPGGGAPGGTGPGAIKLKIRVGSGEHPAAGGPPGGESGGHKKKKKKDKKRRHHRHHHKSDKRKRERDEDGDRQDPLSGPPAKRAALGEEAAAAGQAVKAEGDAAAVEKGSYVVHFKLDFDLGYVDLCWFGPPGAPAGYAWALG